MFYIDRTVGRNSDHRDSGGNAPACAEQSAGYGKKHSCKSNLKQLGLAAALYSDDNQEYIVPGKYEDLEHIWVKLLGGDGSSGKPSQYGGCLQLQ